MKRIVTVAAALLITASAWAQSPEKMSYQAVVRDASNTLVTTQTVGMQISILQGGAAGSAVYVETQTPSTNANGLVSIEIGTGTIVSGDFTTIDWANDSYFIRTETDPVGGTNYTITGTSQLLSVPYALHSKTAENITGTITEADPAFTSSNAFNITSTDITNLGNLSGVNTGDQDLSNLATQQALDDSVAAIRLDVPESIWTLNGNNTYFNQGLVGIGVTNPTAVLDVYDNVGYPFFKFLSDDNVYTQWVSDRLGVHDYQIGIDGGNNKFIFANTTTIEYPLVIHDKNIGIFNLNPEAPLHINDFMKIEPRSTAPSPATIGMIYYDSNDDKLKVYTGSVWENLN
jgi:hypothetical protein